MGECVKHYTWGSIAALVLLLADGACLHAAGAEAPKHLKVDVETPIAAETSLPRPSRRQAFVRFFAIASVLAERDADEGTASVAPAARQAAKVQGELKAAPPDLNREPFGFRSFRAPEGEIPAKWRSMQERLALEKKALAECRADRLACGSVAAMRFLAILDEAQKFQDPSAQMAAINRLVNSAIRYTSDSTQYGVPDRWSSPLETFATGEGDCEDYAIAKYAALQEIGFEPSNLKLLLVSDIGVGEGHAVLAVRHDGRWLVLDSRRSLILEDAEIEALVPVFALDQAGVELLAAPFAISKGGLADQRRPSTR